LRQKTSVIWLLENDKQFTLIFVTVALENPVTVKKKLIGGQPIRGQPIRSQTTSSINLEPDSCSTPKQLETRVYTQRPCTNKVFSQLLLTPPSQQAHLAPLAPAPLALTPLAPAPLPMLKRGRSTPPMDAFPKRTRNDDVDDDSSSCTSALRNDDVVVVAEVPPSRLRTTSERGDRPAPGDDRTWQDVAGRGKTGQESESRQRSRTQVTSKDCLEQNRFERILKRMNRSIEEVIFVDLDNWANYFGRLKSPLPAAGDFHHQADAEWIVIGGLLRGHNDKPCGRPTPGWAIGRPGVGHPYGVFGVFINYQLVT
jgi:hypothetical protein